MASYSMATLILPILIFALSIILSQGGQDSSFLNKVCSNNSQTYAPHTLFANNLDTLFENTPKNHGFSNASAKAVYGSAYGLALCRGDVSPADCEYCLHDAKCKVTNHCNKRTAMVWYDNCQLKYSENDFIGEIDEENSFVMINVNNVTSPLKEKFREASIGLLKRLSKQAATNKYMFAGGEELFDKEKNVTLYGMAQCTRDLSSDNCNKCLDGAVERLPINNKTAPIYSVGGRVVGASCTVRYEPYTFLKKYESV